MSILEFSRKVRFSRRPSKQFLWFLFIRDMKASYKKNLGIDVGCGDMANKRFFRTKTYLGIDCDEERLRLAKLRNPDAETFQGRVEEVNGIQGDIVVCLQVFNNKFFDPLQATSITRKLAAMVKPGGSLIFNTGKRTLEFEEELDALLAKSFRSVIKTRYGAMSNFETPVALSVVLALAMLWFPSLRTAGEHAKSYYSCSERI